MFPREELKEVRNLGPMQQGMLHHALLEPASSAHHEQLLTLFEGRLNDEALLAAWQWVVDRHEALRGRFIAERTSRPAHLVPRHEPVSFSRYECESGHGDSLPETIARYLEDDRARPFSLSHEHPMRLVLFHCGAAHHWLVWSFHHVLLDGWSIGIVLGEVLQAYQALAEGKTPDLKPPPSYSLYEEWLASRDRESALAYWRQQLAGYDQPGLLPAANPAAAPTACATVEQGEPARYRVSISGESWRALKALAQHQRATLHHLLVAAWAVAVGRFGNRRDVVIGTVVAGRPTEIRGVERLVGMFINTLPFRVRWNREDSFSLLLGRVRDDHLNAAAHQHLSLAEFGGIQGSPVDHLLLVQNLPYEDVLGPVTADCNLSRVIFREQNYFGLEVTAIPAGDQLSMEWRYNPDVVNPEQVVNLARLTEQLLGAIAATPRCPLGKLDVLGDAWSQVLHWGDGGLAPTPRGTILELFGAQVAATPDGLALVAGDDRLSYRQLDQAADRLARGLLARWPLGPNDRVALVAGRDAGLVIGLLAILKTGAAYVPIDPEFPAERVRLMLMDSGCRLTLAAPGLLAEAEAPGPVWWLGAELPEAGVALAARSGPDDLAYVIFTSGSTGRPKGTQILQRNVASFFAALPGVFGFQPQRRILALTTVSFDMAGLELLGALCGGMTVVLATAAQARDPIQVFELITRHRIQVLQLTPTRLKLLLEAGDLSALNGVETLLVGGEALPRHLADRLVALPATRTYHVYGPTETTIWSSAQVLEGGPLSLGRALPGERLFVLSSEQDLQPAGAVGEIAIAGDGVGAGYLSQPEKTAERFVSLPELAPGRVYLTGDLGRWRADGSLEFLGRLDHQIKVRGTRIEPAEIEHHLRQQAGVDDALVVARPSPEGDTELVAYLISRDPALRARDTAGWRTRLASTLPDPFIPARYCVLDAFPQNANGKIDRRALPDPQPCPAEQATRVPANAIELAITQAFSAILQQPIGPENDFFAHGGHSLSAMRVIGRINRELRSALRLKDLYLNRTAASLAERVIGKPVAEPIPRAPEASDYPLSYSQQALWILDQVHPGYTGYNVPGAYQLTGPLDEEALQAAWQAVVSRHESLRTTFHAGKDGPRQRIHDAMPFTLERHNCRDWSATAVAEKVAEITGRPFDLATGPLFRMALLATGDAHRLLVLVMHHIISDGWSDQILAADLGFAYGAGLTGHDPAAALAPPPKLRYRDFAVWQRDRLQGGEIDRHLSYWREKLSELPLLELRTDHPRQRQAQRSGSRIALVETPFTLASSRRFAVLVAATVALLHLESRQTDICLGVPVAGRERPELQDQVGFHLNLLPLRLRFSPSHTLADLERMAAAAIVEALEHAEFPFACLVERLGLSSETGRHPVFDVLLIIHQYSSALPSLAGLQVEPAYEQSYTSRYDLDFEAWVDEQGLRGFIEYDNPLFSPASMAVLAGRWRTILRAAVASPETTLSALRQEFSGDPSQETARFIAQTLALDEEF